MGVFYHFFAILRVQRKKKSRARFLIIVFVFICFSWKEAAAAARVSPLLLFYLWQSYHGCPQGYQPFSSNQGVTRNDIETSISFLYDETWSIDYWRYPYPACCQRTSASGSAGSGGTSSYQNQRSKAEALESGLNTSMRWLGLSVPSPLCSTGRQHRSSESFSYKFFC